MQNCQHQFEIWYADQSAHALQKTRKLLFCRAAVPDANIFNIFSKVIFEEQREIFEADFD